MAATITVASAEPALTASNRAGRPPHVLSSQRNPEHGQPAARTVTAQPPTTRSASATAANAADSPGRSGTGTPVHRPVDATKAPSASTPGSPPDSTRSLSHTTIASGVNG